MAISDSLRKYIKKFYNLDINGESVSEILQIFLEKKYGICVDAGDNLSEMLENVVSENESLPDSGSDLSSKYTKVFIYNEDYYSATDRNTLYVKMLEYGLCVFEMGSYDGEEHVYPLEIPKEDVYTVRIEEVPKPEYGEPKNTKQKNYNYDTYYVVPPISEDSQRVQVYKNDISNLVYDGAPFDSYDDVCDACQGLFDQVGNIAVYKCNWPEYIRYVDSTGSSFDFSFSREEGAEY